MENSRGRGGRVTDHDKINWKFKGGKAIATNKNKRKNNRSFSIKQRNLATVF